MESRRLKGEKKEGRAVVWNGKGARNVALWPPGYGGIIRLHGKPLFEWVNRKCSKREIKG